MVAYSGRIPLSMGWSSGVRIHMSKGWSEVSWFLCTHTGLFTCSSLSSGPFFSFFLYFELKNKQKKPTTILVWNFLKQKSYECYKVHSLYQGRID